MSNTHHNLTLFYQTNKRLENNSTIMKNFFSYLKRLFTKKRKSVQQTPSLGRPGSENIDSEVLIRTWGTILRIEGNYISPSSPFGHICLHIILSRSTYTASQLTNPDDPPSRPKVCQTSRGGANPTHRGYVPVPPRI